MHEANFPYKPTIKNALCEKQMTDAKKWMKYVHRPEKGRLGSLGLTLQVPTVL